jgi:hypothetical protein
VSAVEASLAIAALAIGATGAWSPCGFSMVETIGLAGDRGRRLTTVASSAAFVPGAVAGGVATFGLLSVIGDLVHGTAGRTAYLVAAAVAVVAAVAEARGVRIAPQIRRQVPEHWRRVLPLPLAAAGYGVLLGLGFTTFVLTFAVWALAAVTFAIGRPELGLVVGLAFGAGRALPIVALAPVFHRPIGVRLCVAMAERPTIFRAIRLADAAALLLAGVVIVAAPSTAATRLGDGTDPSAAGDSVVWTTPAGGVMVREGQPGTTSVPAHAVLGGSLIAWLDGDSVHVARAPDLSPVLDVTVPGVDALAVSDTWLVTRAPTSTGEVLAAAPIGAPTQVRRIATVKRPAHLGRPSLDLDTLVYHVATLRESRLVAADLAAARSRVLRRSRSALLTNPALLNRELLYVRQTDSAQLLELGRAAPGARDRALYRLAAPAVHDPGHEPGHRRKTRTKFPRTAQWTLWTSALSATSAYVTLLPRKRGLPPRILAVPR